MQIDRKNATVTAPTDDDFPGTFSVILSTPDEDRDGESLSPDTWESLPDHIPFDIDHGMSVLSTVGSGEPRINEKGQLVVDGKFASTDRAQEVRTLVKEGHITKTSVAFRRIKSQKAGKSVETRELLNGAFVNTPANPYADIVMAKSADLGIKIGSRNNSTDAKHIQAIHDHAAALGAKHGNEPDPDDDGDTADDDTDSDGKSFLAAFKSAPQNVRDQVKSLLAADDQAPETDPAPAAKAAAAEGPSAEDIALKAAALRFGISI